MTITIYFDKVDKQDFCALLIYSTPAIYYFHVEIVMKLVALSVKNNLGRVRPPNQKEQGNNSRTVIKVVDSNVVVFDPKEDDEPFFYHGVQQRGRDLLKKANKNIQFLFDRVFGFECDNAEVFGDSTKNLIQSLMSGYNCSVFVYGATGAGKTHTMLGHNGNPGITFLTMRELFHQIEALKGERDFELGITYLEVYNETVKDLLNPGPPLHLREDGKFGVCVAGIVLHRIKNPEELFALLAKGNGNRTQHPTDANAESSRSHAVFQVYVNMSTRHTSERRIAKLSMIDLAGSERGAATGCSGMRFTEGANINKSLLALGNCINSLADGQRHIPYRDSKLTRLLKDSLGGNCQTVMIANISPSSLNYEDTYNTLKYATRAKKIKSNMKKNVVNRELTIPQYIKLVEELNRTIDSLRAQIQTQTQTVPPATVTSTSCSCTSSNNNCEPNENIESPKKEPACNAQLQMLLKEKHALQTQIQALTNSEELIDYRIKFKEASSSYVSTLCLDNEQLESGRNRIINMVGSYHRQKSVLQNQMKELQVHYDKLETELQALVEKEKISVDNNVDVLQYKTEINDVQMEHMHKICNVYQNEMEQANKLIARMAEGFHQYYQLLQGHGHMTANLADYYRSVVRMAQGQRSVTFENEDASFTNQETAITVNSLETLRNSETKRNMKSLVDKLDQVAKEHSMKRGTIKRKLYETEPKPTALERDTHAEPVEVETYRSESNLNETVVLPEATFNADVINNTFCLHDKEPVVPIKKSALNDRSNTVSAENILPKVYKEAASKQLIQKGRENIRGKMLNPKNAMSRTQRFPLRNKDTELGLAPLKSARGATIRSTTTPSKRFKP
ncbi:Kinesin-like protein at 67A [Carabus blaptoides fortunei]